VRYLVGCSPKLEEETDQFGTEEVTGVSGATGIGISFVLAELMI
jgi:hypothetical protein